ncbi:MAG: DNA gyrase modulator [Thermoplasmata archaeon]
MTEELIDQALRAAGTPGVVYADVRVISPQRYLYLAVRDGAASALTSSHSAGLGVRARTDRAWGFAGTTELTV